MTEIKRPSNSRRDFLKAAAATAVAVPFVVRPSAVGAAGATPPSDRIVIGGIGTGGQGRHNLRQFMGQPDAQVVAVCDVDAPRRKQAQDEVNNHYSNKDCQAYEDFRDLVARQDIDAVMVGTPDHWHALTSIAAAEAGKDIYCEKPLTNSIGEGRALVDAVNKNKRVLQCGSHERSSEGCRMGAELIRNGAIGKVKVVRVNLPTDQGHHQQVKDFAGVPPTMQVPAGFNYDFWLGHTAEVPYTERRCHFWWRFILAYGGGEMTDRGAHIIDIAQLAFDKDGTGPVKFEATGSRNEGSLYDAFMEYEFVNEYEDGLKFVGTTQGPRGLRFEGENGSLFIHIHGGQLEASDPAILKDKLPEGSVSLGRSPGHHRNFLDCVKSRQQPFAPAEAAHRTATICHLNNIAMLLGRPLKWDPKAERVIGDDEANAMLTPKMREPWTLG